MLLWCGSEKETKSNTIAFKGRLKSFNYDWLQHDSMYGCWKAA